jgi:PAS domain S-box-containing protein
MKTPDPLLGPGAGSPGSQHGVSKPARSTADPLWQRWQRFQQLLPERIGLSGLMFAPFAGQLVLALALMMGLSYQMAASIINQLTQELGEQIGGRVVQELDTRIGAPRQINTINSRLFSSGLASPRQLEALGPLLHAEMEAFPGMGSIQVGTVEGAYLLLQRDSNDGIQLSYQPAGLGLRPLTSWQTSSTGSRLQVLGSTPFDVRNELWFRQALRPNGTPSSSSQPLGPLNRPWGAIGGDIQLPQISQFLRQLEIGQGGAVMIVDRRGFLVATSTKQDAFRLVKGVVQRQAAATAADPLIRGASQAVRDRFDLEFAERRDLDGKAYMLVTNLWRDPAGTTWQVIVATPEDNYLGSVKSTMRNSFLILLVTFGLMVVVSRATAGLVGRPLRRVATAADAMARGDLDQRLRGTGVDEVNDLTISFNSMAGQLRQSYGDLETMKDYAESILESMSNGVITIADNGVIRTANQAACTFFGVDPSGVVGKKAVQFFTGPNRWLIERFERVNKSGESYVVMDTELSVEDQERSANLSILPLRDERIGQIGTMLMVEDISDEKRMKGTMARYMDPVVAEQLLSGGSQSLGGTESMATVLFSDIRSFTSISEALGAQGTVSLLNDYFTLMVDCLVHEGGMLDKFIGDAIMAIFGLPLPAEGDEDRAMRASIAMLSSLDQFNMDRAANQQLPVHIGIGLHTDEVVSGNIGSPKRMNYTVIGDGVNLASRLESACKFYGAELLISEATAQRLASSYCMREADLVVVKGKSQPVKIHQVLDAYSPERFPARDQVLQVYGAGLQAYRAQRWDEAMRDFNRAIELHPGDKLSRIYLERSEILKTDPPGSDWDGVWTMTSK